MQLKRDMSLLEVGLYEIFYKPVCKTSVSVQLYSVYTHTSMIALERVQLVWIVNQLLIFTTILTNN